MCFYFNLDFLHKEQHRLSLMFGKQSVKQLCFRTFDENIAHKFVWIQDVEDAEFVESPFQFKCRFFCDLVKVSLAWKVFPKLAVVLELVLFSILGKLVLLSEPLFPIFAGNHCNEGRYQQRVLQIAQWPVEFDMPTKVPKENLLFCGFSWKPIFRLQTNFLLRIVQIRCAYWNRTGSILVEKLVWF